MREALGLLSVIIASDTYTSVLPEFARQSAEDAAVILAARTPLQERHNRDASPTCRGRRAADLHRATIRFCMLASALELWPGCGRRCCCSAKEGASEAHKPVRGEGLRGRGPGTGDRGPGVAVGALTGCDRRGWG